MKNERLRKRIAFEGALPVCSPFALLDEIDPPRLFLSARKTYSVRKNAWARSSHPSPSHHLSEARKESSQKKAYRFTDLTAKYFFKNEAPPEGGTLIC